MNKFFESLGDFVKEHPFIAGWMFVSIAEAVFSKRAPIIHVHQNESN